MSLRTGKKKPKNNMHEHAFIPHKIDKTKTQFSKIGYVYFACECGAIKGSPIKSKSELKRWEEQVSNITKGMY